MRKKAQAHTLVLIILLLIVLYIVILPPEEREALLEDNGDSGSRPISKRVNISTLLEEFPGTLSFREDDKRDIDFPNVNLLESVESQLLAKFAPFTVRNGIFDEKDKAAEFSIPDIKNTDNVFLSFSIKKAKGDLIIKLNGETILEYGAAGAIEPIELRKELLKDANQLEFSASSVGWKFWRTNEYSLEDIKVIGDVTDISRQKSQNSFVVTNAELTNIERSQLRFIPFCSSVASLGSLEVLLNNRNVYSSVPVCDDPVMLDINEDMLNDGSNSLAFRSSRGSYSIEQIRLDIDFKKTRSAVYFFELNESDFINVTENRKDVIMAMRFVDDKETKAADVSVNGHKFRIDQEKPVFTRNIDGFVEEGNNFIEIIPKETLYIVELNVTIKKN